MKNDSTQENATKIARALVDRLKENELKLTLAESCTGGLVSSLITEIPGASEVLWGSFICYTQEAKVSMLNIDNNLLLKYGLVSIETAKAMAVGSLQKTGASIAASCTGLAGPDGDGSAVEVGTVYIAVARKNGEIKANKYNFEGSRNEVRLQVAVKMFEEIVMGLTTCSQAPIQ